MADQLDRNLTDQVGTTITPTDDPPEWRATALVWAEMAAAVAALVVVFLVLGEIVEAWTAHDVPGWLAAPAVGFPLGAAARIAVEGRRIAAAARSWHATAARRVLGPPSTWAPALGFLARWGW